MCLVVAPMKLKLKQCQSTVITPGFRELKKNNNRGLAVVVFLPRLSCLQL